MYRFVFIPIPTKKTISIIFFRLLHKSFVQIYEITLRKLLHGSIDLLDLNFYMTSPGVNKQTYLVTKVDYVEHAPEVITEYVAKHGENPKRKIIAQGK